MAIWFETPPAEEWVEVASKPKSFAFLSPCVIAKLLGGVVLFPAPSSTSYVALPEMEIVPSAFTVALIFVNSSLKVTAPKLF